MAEALLLFFATYLVASLSPTQLIARSYGVDLHAVGARNLGASNLIREVGLPPGMAAGMLDAIKAPLALVVAEALGTSRETQLGCALVAIVAQQWPLWHRFDGGRGNAPGMALILVLWPAAALVAGLLLAAGMSRGVWIRLRGRRRVFALGTPLGMLAVFLLYPVLALWMGAPTDVAVTGALIALLVVVRRLTAGLRADLRLRPDVARMLLNRLLYDRTELQRRELATR